MVTTRKAIYASKSLAKRVQRVERQLIAQRPEMKKNITTFSGSLATGGVDVNIVNAVAAGDAGNQRDGDRIRLWRLEVRGQLDPLQDVYLIQSHDGSAPTVNDFSGSTIAGAHILEEYQNSRFTEWAYFRAPPDQTTNCPIRLVKSFKGMNVVWSDDPTTPERNRLYVVVRNVSGATLNHSMSACMWYTDV